MSIVPRILNVLRESEFRHGPLPDRGQMPVPFPVLMQHVPYDKHDPRITAAPVITIPLHSLRATQRTVDADNLRKFLHNPTMGGDPVVTPYEDGYAIVDGHHRLAAHRLRGLSHVTVKLVGEDAPANAAGLGGVAGLGVGPQGEPGVAPKKKKRVEEAKVSVKRIATSAEFDFWQIGNDVYRAPVGIGSDSTGQPMGKRWECTIDHWKRYRSVFAWAKDIREDAHDRFAGADVFDVPLDTIVRTRAPKKPWERYARYLGQDEDAESIRLHARKEWKKNIILRDARTGVMTYLRQRTPR